MKTVVIKLGGSCLGRPDVVARNLDQVINVVKHHQDRGALPVIVVSALAGETRRLQSMAENLFKDQKDKDQILAQGEMFATKLVGQYLNARRLSAKSMIGSHLPVHATSEYGSAEIKKVDVSLINKTLKEGAIPIIPGFVGRTQEGDIATLGFDGSDTSAVAVAAALGVEECILYKDVQGIYSANPKHVPLAKKWQQLSYENMHTYAKLGANILHERAVKTAWDAGVNLRVVPFSAHKASGTVICAKPLAEVSQAIGLTFSNEKTGAYVTVVGNGTADKAEMVMMHMAEQGTPVNMVQMERHFVKFKLSQVEHLDIALQHIHSLYALDNTQTAPISSVRLTDQLDPALHSFSAMKYTG